MAKTEQIQQALVAKQLCPAQHLVDMGYTNIDLLLTNKKKYGTELVWPMRPDNGWQASAKNGFGAANFEIDWKRHKMKCPMDKKSSEWKEGKDYKGKPVVHFRFARTDCAKCVSRPLCTRSVDQRRALTLRPKEQHQALQIIRVQQQGEAFKESYALRAGIERTISQSVNVFRIRRGRNVGLAKTTFCHLAIAAAINLVRVVEWLWEGGEASKPKDKE